MRDGIYYLLDAMKKEDKERKRLQKIKKYSCIKKPESPKKNLNIKWSVFRDVDYTYSNEEYERGI